MTRLARTLAHLVNRWLGAYDRAHRIGADEVEEKCSCGTDAFSLNPAETIVHRADGCYITPVERSGK